MRHGISEGKKFAGLLICCGKRAMQDVQNEQSPFKKRTGVKELGEEERFCR